MKYKEKILVIDAENSIRNLISTVLTANNYNVQTAKSGAQGITAISSGCPDIILMDINLPDTDGFKLIKSVREWSTIPIIVISERSKERDIVQALDLGADDYITKPFGTSELLARIRVVVRHIINNDIEYGTHKGRFKSGDLVVDFDKHIVSLNNNVLHFTVNEYKIISLLARFPGKVLTYGYIIKNIWGPFARNDNQTLRVNMANIRRKLKENASLPRYIFTVNDVGYRMIDSD